MSRKSDTGPGGAQYVPMVWDASLVAAAHPDRDPRGQAVHLICGRPVSSWSALWLQETCEREIKARAILRMHDREARIESLGLYADQQAQAAQIYLLSDDPEAYGAEARRRLEEVVLARWHAARAFLHEPETTE